MFPALDPAIADLYLLEPHQIAQLPKRAPGSELAAVLHAYPQLRRHFALRHPPIARYVDGLLTEHPPATPADLPAIADELVWEIGDLICYQKAPQLYDERAPGHDWDTSAITEVAAIDGMRVIDAGAGTGQVSFKVVPSARHVFAVEPAYSMRTFIKAKAARLGISNLFAMDGTLDAIPLPESSADLLVTCRAIGWRLRAELAEAEWVVVTGGAIVHLTGVPDDRWEADEWHRALAEAGYVTDTYRVGQIRARRYWRKVS